ncbi:LpqB family beta-propeller domain-containing protein [Streptomyces sp. NPDC087440]|uniref:LpqB family beta-propeller domain-containing protein n=1 Tax=Streptomyces sp. NPDC087440 TaxID=3365790 RepID=UPI00382E8CF4
MGVEGHSRSRNRTNDGRTVPARGLRVTALVAGAGLLLTAAGCGSMPDHGDVREVKASPQVDTQVRVYSVPPRPGDGPRAIVDGFMEAMTSDDPGFDTARKYLTRDASKTWNPGSTATILSGAVPNPAETTSGQNSRTITFKISGERIAELDKQSAYQPLSGVYEQPLHLVKEKGPGKKDTAEWRIENPPPGLVLGESDFQRIFRSVNKYYFAVTAGDSGLRALVADPVYVRKRTDPQTRLDPVAQAVKAVMDGPSAWLRHSVYSRFPSKAALKKGTKTLPIGDHNSLKVPLNTESADADRKRCMDMAAQLLFTLQDLTSSTRIDQVEMMRPDDSSLCTLQKSSASVYAPGGVADSPNHLYFLDNERHLVRMLSASENGPQEAVPGAIGERRMVVRSAGISRDEKNVAAVMDDGHRLNVGPIMAGAPEARTAYRSDPGARETLSAPSWDGMGDLWFADRDQRRPRVMRLVDGRGTAQPVSIERLGEGYVDSLRVSADGVRVALLVVGKDQRKTLKIGRVDRTNGPGGPEVRIVGLRSAAPQMEDVTAMSWAGQSRLVVAGREAGGVQQMRYVRTDGSSSAEGLLPGANQVTAVAASDAEGAAVLAQTKDDGIVRLPPGANWKTLVDAGSMPVYPG